MATAAAASASEPEADPKAGPEAEGEEDEAKADRTRRKVLTRAVATAAYKAMGPAWDEQREEGVSESDGDEEFAMASSAESSPGEDEWEYDEEEEKNQLEIERLEEQVRPGAGGGAPPLPLVPGPDPPPPGSGAVMKPPAGAAHPLFTRSSQRWGRLPGAVRAASHGSRATAQGGGSVSPVLPRRPRLSVEGLVQVGGPPLPLPAAPGSHARSRNTAPLARRVSLWERTGMRDQRVGKAVSTLRTV